MMEKMRIMIKMSVPILLIVVFLVVFPGCQVIFKQKCDCSGSSVFSRAAEFGLTGNLAFDKAPKTNEETHLRWCLKAEEDFEEVHAWVQFEYDSGKTGDSRKLPVEEQKKTMVVDGEIEFTGSLKKGEEKYYDVTVKFPMEGYWVAGVYFYGKSNIRNATPEKGLPRYAGTVEPERLYITDEYGRFDSSGYEYYFYLILPPNDELPVSGYIDIDKPPVISQPVEIKWGVGSIQDIDEVDISLMFIHNVPGETKHSIIPPEQVIASGDKLMSLTGLTEDETFHEAFTSTAWHVMEQTTLDSVIEQSTYHNSFVAVFDKPGNWAVILDINGHGVSSQSFCVSDKESHWGWE
ncbi:MAG: hypothetical protein JW712_07795 [Dehalococcoidales bacterium]|nr:hypothetical protein [Dehalococcoidales bacterium]